MGFEWDTMEMKILLAAKLARPFGGMAQLAINNLHIKGDVCSIIGSISCPILLL
jgi:hypothetical protein